MPLVSQFCLTYHRAIPDGRTVKKHLNAWLTRLRRRFPGVHYLWVLEFQTRGVPHFHVWLSLPHYMPGLQNELADSWHHIAEPDSPDHLVFHRHRKNFIPWDMYAPGYLCKYLDKQSQKAVPSGFTGCGRFWGNSRGLLADPENISVSDLADLAGEEVDPDTGEVVEHNPVATLVRILGRHHENLLKRSGSRWRSRVRSGLTSVILHNSAGVFRQALAWLREDHAKRNASSLPF